MRLPARPRTIASKRRAALSLSLLITLTLPTPLSAETEEAALWYSPDWLYRQKLTVNHEQVAGSLDAFPLLVKLTGDIVDRAQENGNDILFTTDDGTTKLLHEIESFNGELIAWVQLPHLSEITDTDFYVYYGNPEAESQQSIDRVWDANSYQGVWHLNENPATTQHDVSSNNFDSTPSGIDSQDGKATGKIGPAIDFDGTDDYLNTNHNYQFGSDNFSIGVWLKTTTTTGSRYVFGTADVGSNGFIGLLLNSNQSAVTTVGTTLFAFRADGSTRRYAAFTANIYDGQWHYIVMQRDGASSSSVFVDGAQQSLTLGVNNLTEQSLIDTTYPLVFGGLNNRGTIDTFANFSLDNVQISNISRTPEWITTEYRSQCACEDFLTVGDTETEAGTVAGTTTTATSVAAAKTSTLTLSSPVMQAINQLYRTAYATEPTFTDWLYWAGRVVARDKQTLHELLGAMQWQAVFQ